MQESYILGTGTVPTWCKGGLMTYKRPNGEVGFTFSMKGIEWELNAGDMLIQDDNKRITVKRVGEHEGARVSKTVKVD